MKDKICLFKLELLLDCEHFLLFSVNFLNSSSRIRTRMV